MTNVSNIDSVICLKLAETNNQSLCQFERKAFLFCYFFCFIWVVWICCCSSIIAPHLKPAKFIADDNKITITHENLSNPILFRFPIKKSIACMINHDSFGCFFHSFLLSCVEQLSDDKNRFMSIANWDITHFHINQFLRCRVNFNLKTIWGQSFCSSQNQNQTTWKSLLTLPLLSKFIAHDYMTK